jgi:hypothetical protein
VSHGNNELARLARPHAERAVRGLAAVIDDGSQPAVVRVAAARTLLEFGYGLPARRRSRAKPTAVAPPAVRVDWGDPMS